MRNCKVGRRDWERARFEVQNLKYRGPVCKDLKKCKNVVEGNVKTLEKFIEEKTRIIGKKKIFIGDHIICDNYYSSLNPDWDTINLFEELQEQDNGKMMGGLDYEEFWGSFFSEESNGIKTETFWPNFIKQNCSDCYPFLLSQNFKNFVNFK